MSFPFLPILTPPPPKQLLSPSSSIRYRRRPTTHQAIASVPPVHATAPPHLTLPYYACWPPLERVHRFWDTSAARGRWSEQWRRQQERGGGSSSRPSSPRSRSRWTSTTAMMACSSASDTRSVDTRYSSSGCAIWLCDGHAPARELVPGS
jgi:hypothetical protein